MDISREYEMNLAILANANVVKGEYPLPTPLLELEIKSKRNEIGSYKNGMLDRPSTKSEYLSLLSTLNEELQTLTINNNTIIINNKNAIKAVDDEYYSNIEIFKTNNDNQWTAFNKTVDVILRESEWMLLPDSGLTEAQVDIAKAYRASIFNLRATYDTVETAIANFPVKPYSGVWLNKW